MKGKQAVSYYVTIILISISVFFLLSICGSVFASIENQLEANNNQRAVTSYLNTMILAHNEAGCIEVRQRGKMLVLLEKEEDGVYETRIFVYEGKLMEQYALAESEVDVEEATEIATNEKLQISFVQENLLWISTSEGDIYVNVVAQGGYYED